MATPEIIPMALFLSGFSCGDVILELGAFPEKKIKYLNISLGRVYFLKQNNTKYYLYLHNATCLEFKNNFTHLCCVFLCVFNCIHV